MPSSSASSSECVVHPCGSNCRKWYILCVETWLSGKPILSPFSSLHRGQNPLIKAWPHPCLTNQSAPNVNRKVGLHENGESFSMFLLRHGGSYVNNNVESCYRAIPKPLCMDRDEWAVSLWLLSAACNVQTVLLHWCSKVSKHYSNDANFLTCEWAHWKETCINMYVSM